VTLRGEAEGRMLIDYHVHLERGPYELEWLEQFVQAARNRGVKEIGVVEHAYRFQEAADLLPEDWPADRAELPVASYVDFMLMARGKGLPVRLGIEVDFVPGREEATAAFLRQYPFDFVLGAVHYLDGWGFDNPLFEGEWAAKDVDEVYRQYIDTVARAVRSGLFDVLAHPDVIKIFGHRPSRPADWSGLVRALAQTGTALEVSSAGLRKPVREAYPERGLLKACFAAGVPITLASDAHEPEEAGQGIEEVAFLAKEAGYRKITRFFARRAEEVPMT